MTKEEKAKYNKQYILDHKDEIRLQKRRRYEQKKEEIKEKQRLYYLDHKNERDAYSKKYTEDHRVDLVKKRKNNKDKRKTYIEEHKDEIKRQRKQYRVNKNKEIKIYQRRYDKEHAKQRLEYQKNRRANDPFYRLSQSMRTRINTAFRQILCENKNGHTFDMIGLNQKDLKIYIENKFTVGMTWNNYGKGGWHIDHVIPLSSAKTKEDLIGLCHYTNLQPLWWIDNIKKGGVK